MTYKPKEYNQIVSVIKKLYPEYKPRLKFRQDISHILHDIFLVLWYEQEKDKEKKVYSNVLNKLLEFGYVKLAIKRELKAIYSFACWNVYTDEETFYGKQRLILSYLDRIT